MGKKQLKLTPSMILKRGHYLYFLGYWIYEKIVDYSISKKKLNNTIFNNTPGAYPVQSISYPYIHQLEKHLKLPKEAVFVDVGCAWGRLLGYINSKFDIKKLVGVELNTEVAEQAKQIYKGNEKIQIISGDIIENIPTDATVFYLFNPFDEETLKKFLGEIEKNINHKVNLLYLHPVHEAEFERERWNLLEIHKLKPKHLGSLKLNVYGFDPQKIDI